MRKPGAISRRSFIRKGLGMSLSLLGIGLLTGVYSFLGERFWYQVQEINLTIPSLPPSFKGWRIVQFSDIHLGFHFEADDLGRVIRKINQLKPDIIFFTGDFIQVRYPYAERAVSQLQNLMDPRGGKWAILGNHDYFPKETVVQALHDSNFLILENSYGHIEHNGQLLYIAGVGDVLNKVDDITGTLVGLSEQDCILLLAHEPDFAHESVKYPIRAQFSGHSHGGQVRIPFYGSIIDTKGAKDYMEGLHYVGERKMPLYVNRGIGTTQLPIRFFCRPEITLFHLS